MLLLLVLGACSAGAGHDGGRAAHGSPARVIVVPRQASIAVGQVLSLQGYRRTAPGDSAPTTLVWSASGGSIGPDGVFRSSRAGRFSVIGRGEGEAGSDTAEITVVSAADPAPPSAEVSRGAAAQAGPGPARESGIPFGPWNLPLTGPFPPFTATMQSESNPASTLALLARAKAAGIHVILRMVGGKSNYQNRDGSFNLALWEQRLAAHARVNYRPYVEDGTLLGNFILDEPHAAGQWGGVAVRYQDIEAAAAYSKQLFPYLPTYVRSDPGWLRQAPFKWTALDVSWSQYSARMGPVADYRDANLANAGTTGLGLVMGINVITGGDGSSGIASPWNPKYWVMSARELKTYGTVLAGAPGACAFLMWQYDTTYFVLPDIRAAMDSVAQVARAHPGTACVTH